MRMKMSGTLAVAAACLLGVVAGCDRDNDIKEYRVAKDTAPPASESQGQPQAPASMPPMMASGAGPESAGTPQLQWDKPEGWEQVPAGQMRLASFKVTGAGGKQADVSIVPLPGPGGSDLGNVNRWRGQVGLGPVGEEELPKLGQPVQIAGQTGQLFELAGNNAGSGDNVRMLAAVLRREGTAWFFKMTGDDQLVAQQKSTFRKFLESVKFTGAGPATTAEGAPALPASHPPMEALGGGPFAGASGAGSQAKPDWQVPAGWQEVPGNQFLVAKFALTGADNAQAAVNISASAGDGGGLLQNANRWRGQVGLAPLTEAECQQQCKTLDTPAGKATEVEMAGTDARSGQKVSLVGVIVPQGGRTWFYKLMGSGPLVERERENFIKFVQSAKYPDAS